MANLTDLDAPLYTAVECRTKIVEIDNLISAIAAKPVGVGVPGVGNANYIGRLTDLRKEREIWQGRLEEALAYEKGEEAGVTRSRLQGPRQILE